MSNLLESLESLAVQVAEREGYILYDVEFNEKQRKLIVTIDKDGGVSVDDCANVSRGINLLLDVEDVIPGEAAYDLEVSSPGLERVLNKIWHFEKVTGKLAKVSIIAGAEEESFGNLRAFHAVVEKVEGNLISFTDVKNSKLKKIQVPFEAIHKANLIFEYGRENKIEKKH